MSHARFLSFAIVGALGLGGCGVVVRGEGNVSGMPDVAELSSVSEVECAAELAGLNTKPTCYEVTVPENWNEPDRDDQVILRVAVFSATDPADAVDDPVIYLEGGPGGTTLAVLPYTEELLVSPYVDERDVIMFDQRGVGQSQPNLNCDEVAEVSLQSAQGEIAADDEPGRVSEAFAACNQRLADDGVDFSQYNSVASAHDVEAIRIGLGYEQLNLLGISYGTRLAQTVMRLYPSSLRSVVIDSVMPVAADVHETIEPNAERSMRLVFDACAADAACSATYPTFEDDYFALLDRLNDEPAEVEVFDLTGSTYTFILDGTDLLGLTFSALYDKTTFETLPKLVADANDGNYDAIAFLATLELINSEFFVDGMHYSVECNEEIPFESFDDLTANQPTDAPYDRLQALDEPPTYFDICAEWNAGVAPPVENEPVNSDLPTLLLTGTFDPITPPAYAQQVADNLSKSFLIEFPTEGHGIAPTECGADIVVAFLNDPTVEPDSSCVDTVQPPQWVDG